MESQNRIGRGFQRIKGPLFSVGMPHQLQMFYGNLWQFGTKMSNSVIRSSWVWTRSQVGEILDQCRVSLLVMLEIYLQSIIFLFWIMFILYLIFVLCAWRYLGAAVVEWLSSGLAEQEVRGSIPGLATWISEIGYILLPSWDMAEIPLKRRKSSMQLTNQIKIFKHVQNALKHTKFCKNFVQSYDPYILHPPQLAKMCNYEYSDKIAIYLHPWYSVN